MDEPSEHDSQPNSPASSRTTWTPKNTEEVSSSVVEQVKDLLSIRTAQSKPLVRASLEVNVAILLARVNVSVQLHQIPRAEELLEKAFRIATALEDELLQCRCAFWIGLLSVRRGNVQDAAESFLRAMFIYDRSCPESLALVRLSKKYMKWIEEAIRAEIQDEGEAKEAIHELQTMLSSIKNEEELDETVMSAALCRRCRAQMSGDGPSFDGPPSRKLFDQSSMPLERVDEKPEHTKEPQDPIRSESISSRAPSLASSRYSSPALSPDSVDKLMKRLRNPAPRRRRAFGQYGTVSPRADEQKTAHTFQDSWQENFDSEPIRPSHEGPSETVPKNENVSPETPLHISNTSEDTSFSETLTPEMLEERILSQSGRRTSTGAVPNRPTLSQIKVVDSQENEVGRSYVRRSSTDPQVSSPLREFSLPDHQDDTEM